MLARWIVRPVAAVAAAGFATAGLVIASAVPAAAVAAPITPLQVPSSVLDLTGMTAFERATAAESIGKAWAASQAAGEAGAGFTMVETPVAAAGLGASGTAMVGAAAFVAAFEGTSMVIKYTGLAEGEDVGVDGLVKMLTQAGWYPVKGSHFIANEDVTNATPPGWDAATGNILQGTTGGDPPYWATYSVVADVLDAPAFGQANTTEPTAQITLSLGGTPSATALNNPGTGAVVYLVFKEKVAPFRERIFNRKYAQTLGIGELGAMTLGELVTVPAGLMGGAYDQWGFDHLYVQAAGEQIITWYPVGHSKWTPGSAPDPERVWETRWNCSAGPSGSLRSAVFNEGGSRWPGFPDAKCAAGSGDLTRVEVWEVAANPGGPADKLMSAFDVNPGLTAWAQKYPQCQTGSCALELFRVDPTSKARLSCLNNPQACVNWETDPSKLDNYVCTYGGGDVALNECDIYGPTFNVLTGTPVDTDTGTIPADTALPYGDPGTGVGIPDPGADPGTDPDPTASDCPPPFSMTLGGMGYWVTKGVSCALEAAFVPNTQLLARQVTETTDVVTTRPPFSVVAQIVPVFTSLGTGWSGGCSGSLADFTTVGSAGRLAIPCKRPAGAWFTTLFVMSAVAICLGAALAVWHMLSAAVASRQS